MYRSVYAYLKAGMNIVDRHTGEYIDDIKSGDRGVNVTTIIGADTID
jgi:hypothetical protein